MHCRAWIASASVHPQVAWEYCRRPSLAAPRSTFAQKIASMPALCCQSGMRHGDYGVMVNTQVCGTCNSGSIPGSRPRADFRQHNRARALTTTPRENGSSEPLSPYFILSDLRAKRDCADESQLLGRSHNPNHHPRRNPMPKLPHQATRQSNVSRCSIVVLCISLRHKQKPNQFFAHTAFPKQQCLAHARAVRRVPTAILMS